MFLERNSTHLYSVEIKPAFSFLFFTCEGSWFHILQVARSDQLPSTHCYLEAWLSYCLHCLGCLWVSAFGQQVVAPQPIAKLSQGAINIEQNNQQQLQQQKQQRGICLLPFNDPVVWLCSNEMWLRLMLVTIYSSHHRVLHTHISSH